MGKRKYKQGKFTPTNPQKYLGDLDDIIYRSGWERQYMIYCDENPAILQWNSEGVKIPYLLFNNKSKIYKQHTYWIDFYIKYKDNTGNIAQALIEIKPHAESIEPKRGKKRQKTFLREVVTWVKNDAKWKYARAFAKKHGLIFVVITEKTMPQLLRG